MSYFRTMKQRENPYVMLDKHFINDESISWKAKGLLTYLLSKPDDWRIYETDLVKRATDGKASVSSGIDELIKKGYVYRYQSRTESGAFGQWIYEVYEMPEFNPNYQNNKDVNLDIEPFSPKAENRISENRISENRTLLINDITNNDINNNKSIYQDSNKNNNSEKEKEIDKMDKNDIENFRELISKNIDYENLKLSNPDDSKLIENVYECLVSVLSSNQKSLYVGKQEKSIETVKTVFLELNKEHILYVVESLKSVATKIKNIPAYIITSLFNAHKTIDISKKNKDIANSCKDHLPSQNKFNNFPQRKYDINSMEKQLLGIEE